MELLLLETVLQRSVILGFHTNQQHPYLLMDVLTSDHLTTECDKFKFYYTEQMIHQKR